MSEPTVDEVQARLKAEELLRDTRPRDAVAGLGSGLAAIGAGILGGVVNLVAAPVKGARDGGVAGFAAGVAAGLVGAVVLPVGGIVAGAVQIGRGVANTPEAIAGSIQGKVWNKETREWEVPTALPSTALQAYDAGAAKAHGAQVGSARPVGEDLYALLEVSKDASPAEVKKQYYVLARKFHPDKNPDNAEATEKFQALGRAFQILGNADTRTRYDRGTLDASGQETMDAGIFFTMLFGSDKFEPLVGELIMATAAKAGEHQAASSEMRQTQVARVNRLAGQLACVLDTYDDANPAAFREKREAQAQELAAESFGEMMLHVIGEIYELEAEVYLGNFLQAGLLRLKDKRDLFRAELQKAKFAISAVKNAAKVQALTEELAQKVAENPDDPEILYNTLNAKAQMKHETLAVTLQLMWAVNAVDIRQTIKAAVALVLKEQCGVADAAGISKRRAAALLELGKIFQGGSAPEELRTRSMQFNATLQHMEEVMGGGPTEDPTADE